MKARCGNENPEIPSVLCDCAEGNHPLCTGFDERQDQYVDWSNPNYEPPKKVERETGRARVKDMATRVAPAPRVKDGFAAGLEGSQRAAKAWTEAEKRTVLDAIIAVARRHETFTTDLVWTELGSDFPVTKGMTAMLKLADRREIIYATDSTEISTRGGRHDHGQRLTLWRSLIYKQK